MSGLKHIRQHRDPRVQRFNSPGPAQKDREVGRALQKLTEAPHSEFGAPYPKPRWTLLPNKKGTRDPGQAPSTGSSRESSSEDPAGGPQGSDAFPASPLCPVGWGWAQHPPRSIFTIQRGAGLGVGPGSVAAPFTRFCLCSAPCPSTCDAGSARWRCTSQPPQGCGTRSWDPARTGRCSAPSGASGKRLSSCTGHLAP